ncbi:hypothetical protein NDU88_000609 [Pleurodeles waltl]|uniref:Uncharacterized protein n=1 Tax=Pleurodeles waltl TaxID=8319 RepID=A0AAV7R6I4_PLEWA|nr:hypothetical protein NDU88_000609 [Pleurodeles waltl]
MTGSINGGKGRQPPIGRARDRGRRRNPVTLVPGQSDPLCPAASPFLSSRDASVRRSATRAVPTSRRVTSGAPCVCPAEVHVRAAPGRLM